MKGAFGQRVADRLSKKKGEREEEGGGEREEEAEGIPSGHTRRIPPAHFSFFSFVLPLSCASLNLKNVETAFPRQGACFLLVVLCVCVCAWTCACVCVSVPVWGVMYGSMSVRLEAIEPQPVCNDVCHERMCVCASVSPLGLKPVNSVNQKGRKASE